MCGRYRFTEEQSKEILKIIEEVERKCGKGAWTPGEIQPTAKAPNRKRAEPKPNVIFSLLYDMQNVQRQRNASSMVDGAFFVYC